jgi:hypothetical protein
VLILSEKPKLIDKKEAKAMPTLAAANLPTRNFMVSAGIGTYLSIE